MAVFDAVFRRNAIKVKHSKCVIIMKYSTFLAVFLALAGVEAFAPRKLLPTRYTTFCLLRINETRALFQFSMSLTGEPC